MVFVCWEEEQMTFRLLSYSSYEQGYEVAVRGGN